MYKNICCLYFTFDSNDIFSSVCFHTETWSCNEPVCPGGGALALLSEQHESLYTSSL